MVSNEIAGQEHMQNIEAGVVFALRAGEALFFKPDEQEIQLETKPVFLKGTIGDFLMREKEVLKLARLMPGNYEAVSPNLRLTLTEDEWSQFADQQELALYELQASSYVTGNKPRNPEEFLTFENREVSIKISTRSAKSIVMALHASLCQTALEGSRLLDSDLKQKFQYAKRAKFYLESLTDILIQLESQGIAVDRDRLNRLQEWANHLETVFSAS